MDQIGCDSALGAPFQHLNIVIDKKRKGRQIIFALQDNWSVTAFLVGGGIAIQDLSSYRTDPTSLFIQCTNCSITSGGFLCIGYPNMVPGSTQRQPRRRNRRRSGVLNHAFIAIPQGLFFRGGKIMVALHRLHLKMLVRSRCLDS